MGSLCLAKSEIGGMLIVLIDAEVFPEPLGELAPRFRQGAGDARM